MTPELRDILDLLVRDLHAARRDDDLNTARTAAFGIALLTGFAIEQEKQEPETKRVRGTPAERLQALRKGQH